mgnify:CR=1 FL=1
MIADLAAFLVFGLLPLAILVAIVSAFVEARRQAALEDATGEAADDSGIGTVRRLFIYTLALVGLVFAAVGVAVTGSSAAMTRRSSGVLGSSAWATEAAPTPWIVWTSGFSTPPS